MSDTYNENEIVKCKHLDAFAKLLALKLDGTSSLPQRTYNIEIGGTSLNSSYTARVGFSQLTWNSTYSYFSINSVSFSSMLKNNQQPTAAPKIVNITSSNPDVSYKTSSVAWYLAWYPTAYGRWYITSGPTGANSSDKKEVTFTFQIQIPAGDGFAAYLSPVITVEIYDDSE